MALNNDGDKTPMKIVEGNAAPINLGRNTYQGQFVNPDGLIKDAYYGQDNRYSVDYGLTPSTLGQEGAIEDIRRDNQSVWNQIGNATVRSVLPIIPGAAANINAMIDFEDYANQDAEFGNKATIAANQVRNQLAEEFPIHRGSDPQHFDLGSSGWWLENASGLVESVGSFAVSGAILSAALPELGAAGILGKGAKLGLHALASNQAEGVSVGFDSYEQTLNGWNEVVDGFSSGELSDNAQKYINADPEFAAEITNASPEERAELIGRRAADAGAHAVNANRFNMASNLISSKLFMGAPNTSRSAFNKTFKAAKAKLGPNATKSQITKETARMLSTDVLKKQSLGIPTHMASQGTEELVNLAATNEGTKMGLVGENKYNFSAKEMLRNTLTEEGAETFMMGAIMGVGQVGTTANMYKNSKAKAVANVERQMKAIEANDAILTSNNIPNMSDAMMDMERIKSLDAERVIARNNGDYAKDRELGDKMLAQQAARSFEAGVADQLVDTYNGIAELTPEQAEKQGLDIDPNSENYYKTKAKEAVVDIEALEKVYNKAMDGSYDNNADIYDNRVSNYSYSKELKKNKALLNEATSDLANAASDANIDLFNDKGDYTAEAKSLDEYQSVKEAKSNVDKGTQLIKDNNAQLKHLKSKKGQAEYRAQQELINKKIAELRKAAADKAAETDVDNAETESELNDVSNSTKGTSVGKSVDNKINNKAKEEAGTITDTPPRINKDSKETADAAEAGQAALELADNAVEITYFRDNFDDNQMSNLVNSFKKSKLPNVKKDRDLHTRLLNIKNAKDMDSLMSELKNNGRTAEYNDIKNSISEFNKTSSVPKDTRFFRNNLSSRPALGKKIMDSLRSKPLPKKLGDKIDKSQNLKNLYLGFLSADTAADLDSRLNNIARQIAKGQDGARELYEHLTSTATKMIEAERKSQADSDKKAKVEPSTPGTNDAKTTTATTTTSKTSGNSGKVVATDDVNTINIYENINADMDGLNSGHYQEGEVVQVEIDTRDGNKNDAFEIVSYKDGERKVLGLIPNMQDDATFLNDKLKDSIKGKKADSNGIIKTGISVKITGFDTKISRSKERGSVTDAVVAVDSKDALSSRGGFAISYVKDDGTLSLGSNGGKLKPTQVNNAEKGAIFIQVRNPLTGELLPIRVFNNKLGSSPLDSTIVSELGSNALDALMGAQLDVRGRIDNAWFNNVISEFRKNGLIPNFSMSNDGKSIVFKSNLLKEGGPRNNSVVIPIAGIIDGSRSSEVAREINDMNFYIDPKRINSGVKTVAGFDWAPSMKSKRMTYNQVAGMMLAAPFKPGQYLENTRARISQEPILDKTPKKEATEKKVEKAATKEIESEVAAENKLKNSRAQGLFDKYKANTSKDPNLAAPKVDLDNRSDADKKAAADRAARRAARKSMTPEQKAAEQKAKQDKLQSEFDKGKPNYSTSNDKIQTKTDEPKASDFAGKKSLGALRERAPGKQVRWNEAQETEWLNENLPGITVDVRKNLDNLVDQGVEAMGMFHNGTIYLSRDAAAGTAYHEAYHAIYRLFATPAEKKMLDAYSIEKYGKVDEEAVADDFMDSTNELISASFPTKVKNFFKKLWWAVRSFAKTDSKSLDELVYRTNRGYYKDHTVDPKIAKKFAPAYRVQIEGWTVSKIRDAADVIIDQAIDVELERFRVDNAAKISEEKQLVADGKMESTDITRSFETLSDAKLIGILMKQGENIFFDALDSLESKVDDGVLSQENFDILDQYLYPSGKDDGALYTAVLDRLRVNRGIDVTEQTVKVKESKDGDDLDTDNVTGERYSLKFTEISQKDNVRANVRKFIDTLKIKDNNSWLGIPVRVNNETMINTLVTEMAGILDVDHMVSKLSQLSTRHPQLQQVVDKINGDNQFKTEFFASFSSQQGRYISTGFDFETGRITHTSPNRQSAEVQIKTNWKSNSSNSSSRFFTKDKDGKVVPTDTKTIATVSNTIKNELASRIETPQALTDADAKFLAEVMNNAGIDMTPATLITLNNTGVMKGVMIGEEAFTGILDVMAKGENPYTDSTILNYKAKRGVDKLADAVKFASPNLYDNSFKSARGVTMYANIQTNFTSNLISKFNDPETAQAIIDQYLDDPIFNTDGYESTILEDIQQAIANGEDVSTLFDVQIIDGHTRQGKREAVGYSEMNASDHHMQALGLFFNNTDKNNAYYTGPVLADAPTRFAIKGRKMDNTEVIDALLGLGAREYARIQSHAENNAGISNFKDSSNGTTENGYHMMPMLRKKNGKNPLDSSDASKKAINEYFDKEVDKLIESMIAEKTIAFSDKGRITDKSLLKGNVIGANDINGVKKILKNFLMNDHLVRSEFSLLTIGDPAFYKADAGYANNWERGVDYYKRAKEIWSPRTNVLVGSKYNSVNGETITVPANYNTVYLEDVEIQAPSYDTVSEILDDAVKSNALTKAQADEIIKNYGDGKGKGKISYTDAQAYVSLPMYRNTMIGMGQWNDAMDKSYYRLLDGKGTNADIASFMQPIKPFAYGLEFDPEIGKMVPNQHKNSEYVLLPQLVKGNEQLDKLHKSMVDNNIDIVHFDTAIKAGAKNVVSYDSDNNTFDISTDPEAGHIHEKPMTMRGIQQATPAHHISSSNKYGSQIRKLALSDINFSSKFKGVGIGGEMSGSEMKKLYDDIMDEDLRESYDEVADEFLFEDGSVDWKSISKALIKSANDLGKGEEVAYALSYDEKNDRLMLPLEDPLIRHEAEKLLSSVMKNRITNQKISGGSFVQLSSWGMSEDLKIVRNEDGGISHFETMIPATHEMMHDEKYLDADGNIDFNKVSEDFKEYLDEMIGYRIPTEDKYSIAPMKVVGFLPEAAGGAVMLPAEITAISGSDFDVDKLYVMMKELEDGKVAKYDYSKTPAENSRAARMNAKIDVIRAVVRNPETAGKVFTPGGFERNRDVANWIEAKKAAESGSDVASMMSFNFVVDATIRNMTGPQLVGVAANSNAHHAARQGYGMVFAKPMKFDGIELSELGKVKALKKFDIVDGEVVEVPVSSDISRNYSEFLAMVVDNAKDPLAAKMGYNMETAGLFDAIISVGFDTTTAAFFANHPVIKHVYKTAADDFKSPASVINKILNITSEDEVYPSNVTTKDLFNAMNDKYDKGNAEQMNVLKLLRNVLDNSQALNALINVSKSDSKGANGTSPFNYRNLQEKLTDMIISPVKPIENIEGFLNGSMVSSFTTNGVKKPYNNIMTKVFNHTVGNYDVAINRMSSLTGRKFMSAKGMETLTKHMVMMANKNHGFFADAISMKETVTKAPSYILEYINKRPELLSNDFVKLLDFLRADSDKNLVDQVRINTMGKLSSSQTEAAHIGFDELINNYPKLAKMLLKYSQATKGMDFGFGSFSQLIPVEAKTKFISQDGVTLTDAVREFASAELDIDMRNRIIDQIIRNNVADHDIVPYISNDDLSKGTKPVKNQATGRMRVTVDNLTLKDKGFLSKVDGEERLTNFISMANKGKHTLFEIAELKDDSVIFEETFQLGIQGKALEYDLSKDLFTSEFEDMRGSKYEPESFLGDHAKTAEPVAIKRVGNDSMEAALERSGQMMDAADQHQVGPQQDATDQRLAEEMAEQFGADSEYDIPQHVIDSSLDTITLAESLQREADATLASQMDINDKRKSCGI